MIQAKMPDGSPDYTFLQFLRGQAPQLELMLQAMLAERFNLKFHRETKAASRVRADGSEKRTKAQEGVRRDDSAQGRHSVKNLPWPPRRPSPMGRAATTSDCLSGPVHAGVGR